MPLTCETSAASLQQYVHKEDPSEVLLTGWHTAGPDSYRLTARWPRAHRFYCSANGLHDPLLIAESVRQAVPLLSHAAYDVPFGHRQSWSEFGFSLEAGALTTVGDATEVELHVSCTDVVRRGGRLGAMTMTVDITADGARLGTAQSRFSNHPPAIYRRLRREYADLEQVLSRTLPPCPPLPAARVAREDPRDVVLSPTGQPGRSRLRVDLSHPVLFDHPVDHAPGMLLLEAARQAAHDAAGPHRMTPVAMDCVFLRYAEFDAPCFLQTDRLPQDSDGHARVLVTATQRGNCVFSATVALERPPAPIPTQRPRPASLQRSY
jgi:hypothetical protein